MTSGKPVLVNARVLRVPSNGQKRVAQEIISRLAKVDLIAPRRLPPSGLSGHFWEQCVLPPLALGRRLWSPSTSGPVGHPNHIVTVHDIAFVDGPEWFSRTFAVLYDRLTRTLVRTSRHIVAVSEFSRCRLIEHYRAREDRVTTIHSGPARAFFRRSQTEIDEVLHRLGLNGIPFIIAFLGSDPRKNAPRIMAAWGNIAKRFPEARLVTFGRISNRSVFATQGVIEQDRSIIHAGPISDDDLACLYSAGLGLVFPSLYEGFGLPVVEAASCGCRIVTANGSSLPEVAPPDALLVDSKSIDEIGQAMNRLLATADTEPAKVMRIEAMRKFNWDNAARGYEALFNAKFS